MNSQCFKIYSPKKTISVKKDCNGIAIDTDISFDDLIPKGTTAQRPVNPPESFLRYNTTLHSYEYWNGSSWIVLNGGGNTPIETGQIPFYHDVITTTGQTYQDNRLIGATDIAFWYNRLPVAESSYTFNTFTGIITFLGTNFTSGDPLTVFLYKYSSEETSSYSDEYSNEYF